MRNLPASDVELCRWDQVGVWASVTCAVHCLVAPLVFLALPSFSGIWAHPGSHALMALLVLPLACVMLTRGYRVHRKTWIAVAAVAGIGCILVGCALPLFPGEVVFPGEVAADGGAACASCCPQVVTDDDGGWAIGWPAASIATVLGSGLLAACHFGNLAGRRCCEPAA